jgi:hypothetical protein
VGLSLSYIQYLLQYKRIYGPTIRIRWPSRDGEGADTRRLRIMSQVQTLVYTLDAMFLLRTPAVPRIKIYPDNFYAGNE